jgi:hypothetical protein
MKPEDAVRAAREEVARRRAAGGYAEPEKGLEVEPVDKVSNALLLEWALIEPDMTKLRSTRRLGGPVTWLKRLLARGLQQYHNEVNFQQTRFNIHLLRKVMELEERVERIESDRTPS